MDRESHWEAVYGARLPNQVGWYRPHLERSLAMTQAVADTSSEIVDVGGGASTLADDLLDIGYTRISVLDVSSTALALAKARLGKRAHDVTWLHADVTKVELPRDRYDVWHDRAVFHFLTDRTDRAAYVEVAHNSIKSGGHLIIATFSLEGPVRCSGLDIVRYSSDLLGHQLGEAFTFQEEFLESHVTPAGIEQKFMCCVFQRS